MPAYDHIDAFDTTVHKTYEWINDLNRELDLGNRRRSYEILRAFLHALRDRTTVEEVAQLGAQLPMLMRGFYYEGWDPTDKPDKMDAEQFLDYVRTKGFVPKADVEESVKAAMKVLREHISEGEVNQVVGTLPKDIQRVLH